MMGKENGRWGVRIGIKYDYSFLGSQGNSAFDEKFSEIQTYYYLRIFQKSSLRKKQDYQVLSGHITSWKRYLKAIYS